MLKKIISGGQTGADQAGLDVAIKFNIRHGGWIPKGRLTEDGPLSSRYRMTEMKTADYRERTKKNIEDSHGTVIVSRGELTGGSKLTLNHARVINRPHIYIDLLSTEDFEASIFLKSFILENQIEVLNVAGPRRSHHPGIYADVKMVLEAALYLLFLDTRNDIKLKQYLPEDTLPHQMPVSIRDAVDILCHDFSLKTRTFIARQNDSLLYQTYFVFLDYIRHRLGFDEGNPALLDDCRRRMDAVDTTVEDAVMHILKQLKKTLQKDHLLRVVK